MEIINRQKSTALYIIWMIRNYFTSLIKRLMFIFFLINVSCSNNGKAQKEPLAEKYSSSFAVRSGVTLGGIGVGGLELRKDGNFYNWSIFNNYPYGAGPFLELPVSPNKRIEDSYLFFLVRYEVEGEKPKLKLLQINNSLQEGGLESIAYYYPWMQAVENIEYSGRFPFINIKYTDEEMPFEIRMEAFSPFIPHDLKNSSLPGVYFNFEIDSKSNKPVDVMLLGSLRNLVGYDDINRSFSSELIEGNGYKFFSHSVEGISKSKSTFGNMGLGIIGGDEISYYLGWEHKHPYYESLLVEKKLANIDDTKNRNIEAENGKTVGRYGKYDNDQRCFSSIAVSHKLLKSEKVKQTFFLNWNFPNNYGAIKDHDESLSYNKSWPDGFGVSQKKTKNIGHYYQNYFNNINEIVNYFVSNSYELKERSRQFIDNLYQSDIDQFVIDQVNSHLNTFITSSTFTKSGRFSIREGITPSQVWGPMATVDVALYGSQMTIALYPELQKTMMKSHRDLQTSLGEINHGLSLDPDYNQNGTWGVYDRVDLVPNYIQMVLRDYFWTNDTAYLSEMWPSIKLGIQYVLNYRDKDGDMMPNMEGIMCSYDNFPMYGMASYIQSQWISALTMASIAAKDLNDIYLQELYANIAEEGSKLMEDKLWNGKYFRLSNDYLGERGIDEGCLTDQLIGQWVADCNGLGYLFDSSKVSKAMDNILEMSYMDSSFLRICSWAEYPDLFPIHTSDLWVDHANTAWTGVELAFASFLIYENKVREGLNIIKSVDSRYRKNGLYWDHQEYGGHYYRPMSSWSIINAFLGLSIDRNTYTFAPKLEKSSFRLFFSGPEGTAFYHQNKNDVKIETLTGNLVLKRVIIDSGYLLNESVIVIKNSDKITQIHTSWKDKKLILEFDEEISLVEGDVLKVLTK